MGRILLIAYRQELFQFMEKRKLDYLCWTGKEPKNP